MGFFSDPEVEPGAQVAGSGAHFSLEVCPFFSSAPGPARAVVVGKHKDYPLHQRALLHLLFELGCLVVSLGLKYFVLVVTDEDPARTIGTRLRIVAVVPQRTISTDFGAEVVDFAIPIISSEVSGGETLLRAHQRPLLVEVESLRAKTTLDRRGRDMRDQLGLPSTHSGHLCARAPGARRLIIDQLGWAQLVILNLGLSRC